MADKELAEKKKSPLGAVILSALFPGFGLFYLGNYIKGIAFLMLFVALIVLASHGTGAEIPIFVLISFGFYIFQLLDCFEETKKINQETAMEQTTMEQTGVEQTGSKQNVSLFAAVVILIVGILFQMATLEIITFHQILRLWPLVLIGLGGKYVYTYMMSKETNGGSK